MKRLTLILVLLAMQQYTNAQFQSTITGTIATPGRSYIVIKYTGNYSLKNYTDTIKLASDNSFTYNWKFTAPYTTGRIELSPTYIFMVWTANKGVLSINIPDTNQLPVYSGALAKLQQYADTDRVFKTTTYKGYKQRNPNLAKPEFTNSDGYFIIQDSLTNDRIAFLNQYFGNTPNVFEKQFISQQKDALIYDNLYAKLAHNNAAIEKFKPYQTVYRVSNTVTYDFSGQVSFNNKMLLYNASYLRMARNFFMDAEDKLRNRKAGKISFDSIYNTIFAIIDKVATNPYCNALFKAVFVNDEINNTMSAVFDEATSEPLYRRLVDTLQANPLLKKYAALVEQNLNNKLNRFSALKTGTPAPAVVLTGTDGTTKTWTDFKGKTIYIDVWASWCGPCISAMPYWNRLVEKYKNNNNIVFLTVSIDDNKDEWLKALSKYKPEGLHFLSSGGWQSELAKQFKISGVPANVLIDSEGNIIKIRADNPEHINLEEWLK